MRLRFEDGKVVDASAERGEEFLIEMLDTDEGARRLGELGIGTNYGIATGTKEILLDEKIGGTVHLAIGMSYPETGGDEQLRRPLGHGLRPAPGRLAHRRRRASCSATAGSWSRAAANALARCFVALFASSRWSARLSRLSPSSASVGETAQANVTPTSSPRAWRPRRSRGQRRTSRSAPAPPHRGDHRELVAADARQAVALAHRALGGVGDGAQHDVAGRVAVLVVDRLEVVEVEQHQRVAARRSPAAQREREVERRAGC